MGRTNFRRDVPFEIDEAVYLGSTSDVCSENVVPPNHECILFGPFVPSMLSYLRHPL